MPVLPGPPSSIGMLAQVPAAQHDYTMTKAEQTRAPDVCSPKALHWRKSPAVARHFSSRARDDFTWRAEEFACMCCRS